AGGVAGADEGPDRGSVSRRIVLLEQRDLRPGHLRRPGCVVPALADGLVADVHDPGLVDEADLQAAAVDLERELGVLAVEGRPEAAELAEEIGADREGG